MAGTNKQLARSNKSCTGGEATKERETDWIGGVPLNDLGNLAYSMKSTFKIRFTEPQIALVMRAHPSCNLDGLTEVAFEFDQAGKIIDCVGTVRDAGNNAHNYAGSGLMRLYETARQQLTDRQASATILQFPNRGRLVNA